MINKSKKPNKYSYTMLDTYLTCPMKYKLNYVDNLTINEYPSHFFFGGAIDQASEIIFRDKLKENPIPFKQEDMIEAFMKAMSIGKHLGGECDIPTNPIVKYSKGQIQLELLEQDNVDDIFEFADEMEIELDSIEKYVELCQNNKDLSEKDRRLYNLICWHTFVNKGIFLLNELKKWSDENIKEVYSIQRKFEIINGDGDILGGLMDLEAVMMDGSFRLLDLKTAANPVSQYPDDCIKEAMQLHIYSQESSNLVGYMILDKQIRVKEPRVRSRIILGEVTEEMLDETFETVDNIIDGIKSKHFPKNKDACYSYGRCEYASYCWKGNKKYLVDKWKNSPKKDKTNFTKKVKQ